MNGSVPVVNQMEAQLFQSRVETAREQGILIRSVVHWCLDL